MKQPSALREVLAGAVGYLIFAASAVLLFQLSGYDPFEEPARTFQILSILYGVAFAFLGGYVTAMISPQSPIRPALIAAFLIAIGAILSLLTTPDAERWSQLAALLLMAPGVVLGARARYRRDLKRRDNIGS